MAQSAAFSRKQTVSITTSCGLTDKFRSKNAGLWGMHVNLFFSLLVAIDFFSLAPFFFVVCYLDSNVAILGNRYLEPRACHSTPRSVPMSPEIVDLEVPLLDRISPERCSV